MLFSRKLKIFFIALCILFVGLLNLTRFFVLSEKTSSENVSIIINNYESDYDYRYNNNLVFYLQNPNSANYKHYFDKYIENVYVQRKLNNEFKKNHIDDSEIKNIYYKTKLDKLIE